MSDISELLSRRNEIDRQLLEAQARNRSASNGRANSAATRDLGKDRMERGFGSANASASQWSPRARVDLPIGL